MTLFRSSLFTVRAGNQDIAIGPSLFVQTMLAAVDRSVDRLRAQSRAPEVGTIMKGVSYAKAKALPAYCLQLMQNVPQSEQEKLGAD
jgi:hypothetical protein